MSASCDKTHGSTLQINAVKIMAIRLFPTLWQKMLTLFGAFGYSGRWIAKELLNCGYRVRTLTNAIGRDDPFNGQVEVRPIDFTNHDSLVSSLS